MRLLATIFVLLLAPLVNAQAIYTAASCNNTTGQLDVGDCVQGNGNGNCHLSGGGTGHHTAVDGDTIVIPSGSCTWNTRLSAPSGTNGITITGTGTPNSTGATTGASASCSSGTIITDHLTSGPMISFSPTFGASTSRLSCMKLLPFLPYSGYGIPITANGVCTSSGCPNFRMDNITMPSSWGGIGVSDDSAMSPTNVFGVADHNTIGDINGGGNGVVLANVAHGSWKGVNHWGDNSWASPDTFGTNQAFYLENNTFNFAIGTDADVADQNHGGGRYVCRFNTFNNVKGTGACANHGNDTAGRTRGGRQVEAYYNTGSQTAGSTAFGSRSGVGIVFGNTWTNAGGAFKQLVNLDPQRRWRPNKFGPCNGNTIWDTNDGVVYYGPATIGSWTSINGAFPNGSNFNIVDSGSPGWTTSQWALNGAPYSIADITKTSGAEIINGGGANSNNVAVPDQVHGYNPANGDSYQILRASVCMDQPSRSGGQLLKGGDGSGTVTEGLPGPVLSSTGNPGPVNETLDPWYEAFDTLPATATGTIGSATNSIVANKDWYSETINQAAQTDTTHPFNGTAGTGHGLYSRHPTTCTNGTGYLATDQGSWNTFDSRQGQLYICSGGVFPAVGSPSYVPYTYPHPLISGGGGGTATLSVSCPSSPCTSYAFGNVVVGLTLDSSTFTLTNTGTATLSGLVAGFVLSDLTNYQIFNNICVDTLLPSATCTFNVRFKPQSTGSKPAQLTFTTNASNSPTVVPLSGTGIAPIVTFCAASLNLGFVPLNTNGNPVACSVTNTGNANLIVTTITLNIPVFQIVSNTCGSPATITNSIPGTGFTLTPGNSCTFSVQALAPAGPGTYSDNITFADNTIQTFHNLPITFQTTGTPAPATSIFAWRKP